MNNRISKIRKLVSKFESDTNVIKRRKEVQERLRVLVDTFGVDEVIAATGYSESTIHQYLRVKTGVLISELTVRNAEEILSQL